MSAEQNHMLVSSLSPHSVEAEQAVLGSILLDPSCIPHVLQVLTPDDFYSDVNQRIFEAALALYDSGQTVDAITILDKVAKAQGGQDEKFSRYVVELLEITPTATNVLEYARIVREKSQFRSVQVSAAKLIEMTSCESDISAVLEALQACHDSLESSHDVEVFNFMDVTKQFYEELTVRQREGKTLQGMPSGFPDLDSMLGGLAPKNLYVLAARPGMGKTALALNIATRSAEITGETVLVFSLEMSKTQLTERVYANYAGVGLKKLRDATLTSEDWQKMAEAATRVTELNVLIVEQGKLPMETIIRVCRRFRPSMVVIDHMGLIKTSGRYGNRREAVIDISHELKAIAKDLDIPVLALCQLNRDIMGRKNKCPMLSDLRDSGAVEEDADAVLFIDRPAYYEPTVDEREANVIVAKNRHGETGTIPLLWYGPNQRYEVDWTRGDGEPEPLDTDMEQEELPL